MARSLRQRSELEHVANNELGALLARLKSETLASYRTLLDNVYDVLYSREPVKHELYLHVEGQLAALTQRLASEGWQPRDVTNVLRMAVSHDD